ncbi:MAG: SDR family oxidoreductase [Kofleriaceae bacterium]
MHDKEVVLVSGANKGIGLEIVRQLAAKGLTVLAGARDVAKVPTGVTGIQLDVTDDASIARAAQTIRERYGRLDVLVNNAGVALASPIGSTERENLRAMFDVNVFGVVALTQAMLPLLKAASLGRIVMVSSRVGSLQTNAMPGYAHRAMDNLGYPASKAALNMVTLKLAQALEGTRIKVNAACPGYTATDLNGHSGHRSVEQAAREPVRLALLGPDGHTGGFSNEDGVAAW